MNRKFLATFIILGLLMIIPALVLGISVPKDIRSKAANTLCTKNSPCSGIITTDSLGNYVLKDQNGKSTRVKSLKGVIFKDLLNSQVAIVGNIVKMDGVTTLYVNLISRTLK